MIRIYDAQTNRPLGEITQEHLDFLVGQLEEEAPGDQDYYLNRTTLDGFADAGADPALIELLRGAMAGREEMDIRWERG